MALVRTGIHIFTVYGVFLFACSSSTTHDPSHVPDSGLGSGNDGAVENDSGVSDAGTSVSLLAPLLVSVKPMHGGLHVIWENKQAGCDAIQGERKDTGDFKLLFTIPDGTVDNKHDATVTAGKSYTYRVRCKKGDAFSTYSNEITASP